MHGAEPGNLGRTRMFLCVSLPCPVNLLPKLQTENKPRTEPVCAACLEPGIPFLTVFGTPEIFHEVSVPLFGCLISREQTAYRGIRADTEILGLPLRGSILSAGLSIGLKNPVCHLPLMKSQVRFICASVFLSVGWVR